jgi:hypothetical protein
VERDNCGVKNAADGENNGQAMPGMVTATGQTIFQVGTATGKQSWGWSQLPASSTSGRDIYGEAMLSLLRRVLIVQNLFLENVCSNK